MMRKLIQRDPAKRSLQRKDLVLASALGLSVAATVWTAQLDEPLPETVQARSPASRPGLNAGLAAADGQDHAEPAMPARSPWLAPETQDLVAWQPLPPAQPAMPMSPVVQQALPPPAPVAPPFPYRMIGRLDDDQGPQALLTGPQRSRAARVGDTLDEQWRIEAITPHGLQLLWLPAQLPQTLTFGGP